MKRDWHIASIVVTMIASAGVLSPGWAEEPIARPSVGATSITWSPNVENEGFVLTVTGPERLSLRQELKAGETPELAVVDPQGNRLPDGIYSWELRAHPVVASVVREQLRAAREAGRGHEFELELRRTGQIPREDLVLSGSFTIRGGTIVPPDLPEEGARQRRESQKSSGARSGLMPTLEADQVISDDLIVQQNLCVGFDCVNGESFGFDTIRMKESITRLKFEDTSTTTFPANDWQLTANDSASGGAEKFSIEDVTGFKIPFTITAGAATNSVFVDSIGRVGFRTSTPALDLHVNTSNTPAFRLEQNSSGGFTAQAWDIAGNEANFFVRDVTGGSRLPFRIRPGAPTSSLDISADGDIGIGTASPDVRLDVKVNSTGAAVVRLQNQDATGFSGVEFLEPSTTTETVEGFVGVVHPVDQFRINSVVANPMTFFVNGSERMRIETDGDVGIGTTSPAGKLDVNGAIFQRGIQIHADYVFEPGYKLNSIAENAAMMWANKHLPAIGPRMVDKEGREVIELGADRRGIVEELEKAHIYIAQLDEQLLEKEEKLFRVEQLNAALAERLSRIEALLEKNGVPEK